MGSQDHSAPPCEHPFFCPSPILTWGKSMHQHEQELFGNGRRDDRRTLRRDVEEQRRMPTTQHSNRRKSSR
jgi:hypothetical protein